MDRATTAREVVEAYPDRHVSEIMRHAYGDCSCSTDHPPVASPQIQPEECREFRDAYAEGASVGEVSETFARSTNAVTRHLFGRCSHDSTPRDLPPSKVSETTCKQIRETYHGDGDVDVRGVATAVRLRPEVVRFHLYGFCECDHGVPPVQNYTPRNPYHPDHPRLQAGD